MSASSEKDLQEARELVLKAAKIAHDRHCTEIVAMDLMGKSPATDFFLIATGTSNRQTRTVAEEIIMEAKKSGLSLFGKAGMEEGRWVLLDFVTVVVHLFDDEYRDFYDLELLWGDAEEINLEGVLTDEASD